MYKLYKMYTIEIWMNKRKFEIDIKYFIFIEIVWIVTFISYLKYFFIYFTEIFSLVGVIGVVFVICVVICGRCGKTLTHPFISPARGSLFRLMSTVRPFLHPLSSISCKDDLHHASEAGLLQLCCPCLYINANYLDWY